MAGGARVTTALTAAAPSSHDRSVGINERGRAIAVLQNGGVDPGTTISTRRALLAKFLSLATNSLGKLHQLGDTEVQSTYPWVGTPRAFHGHLDHTSITYTARGRDIIVDGGYAAYNAGAYRAWAVSPNAHSDMTTPMSTYLNPTTRLTASSVKTNAEAYGLSDAPGSGISRVRAVLVLKDPDLLVTWDRASARTAQAFQTLWHLPSDQRARVYSRTTAVAAASGDTTKTILFQIPFKQALPAG